MFLGRYEHSIDDKGRLIIPARYRELLEEGAYITQGFDQNLMVMTPSYFALISDNVNHMSVTDPKVRQLKRLIFSSAEKVEVDKVGRILVPQILRDTFRLGGAVMLVGAGEYFEIWALDQWAKQNEILQDAEANESRYAAFDITSR
jgi:MraZ protein